MTYGNSLTLSGTFDQDYNPTNRTVSGSIFNWTYTTDSNGNITEAGSTTYGFDALNRVNAENPGSSISYTYDATSNRLTKVSGGTTTTTVPTGSNKISAVGSNSYTYDSSGNITADGVNTYTWNAEGELSVVKVGGSTVGTYTYNFYRQRAEKVAASTAYYVYGAGGLLYGEYDTSGNFIREYVYLNGAPLAQIDAGSPEVLTYLHTDHLGTPRFGTNSGGTQVWSWNNDAFGTSAPAGTETVNLRMPGQYYDSESGLFYNINRTYNPAIGRYISSDPIGIAGGLNTFSYVAQNPINGIDPLGEYFAERWTQAGTVGGGIAGAITAALADTGTGGAAIPINGLIVTASSAIGGALGYAAGTTADWICPNAAANDNQPPAADPTLGGKVQQWPQSSNDQSGCVAQQEYLNAWRDQLVSTQPIVPEGATPGPDMVYWTSNKVEFNLAVLEHNASCPQYKVKTL